MANKSKTEENNNTSSSTKAKQSTKKIVEVSISNPPLATKNTHKVAKNNRDSDNFFDATLPLNDIPEKNIEQEIEQAKQHAIQEKEMLEKMKTIPDKSKRTYLSSVIACLVTVGICLILTLVFFFWLKWYPVGFVFALITIIASQAWIVFFKKLNAQTDDDFDLEDRKNEETLQQHLKDKENKK